MRKLQITFKDGSKIIYDELNHFWLFDSKERILYIHYTKDNELISVTRIPFESFRFATEVLKEEG